LAPPAWNGGRRACGLLHIRPLQSTRTQLESRTVNLPNLLTLARLGVIPLLMALLMLRFPFHDQAAAALFVVASLTDTLDGNLARRRNQVTELGKFLDPLTDKLFILSVLIVLVQEAELSAWVVIVIFGRELLITVLRSLSASQGRVISATPFGKTKTVSQVLAVLLLILQRPYPQLRWLALAAVAFAVLFTVASGADYLWRFRHVVLRPQFRARPEAAPGGGGPSAGEHVDPRVVRIHELLQSRGWTLAVAESCTGGLLAATFTDRPGCSAFFKGGIVSYTSEVKEHLLQVPGRLLEDPGPVSAEVAEAMADGVRRQLAADVGLAITGIAGPKSDDAGKPVGLTYVWLTDRDGGEGRCFQFSGDRWQNRLQAVSEALELLLGRLAKPAMAART